MSRLETLKKRLKRGQVYRRADLAKWSNAVDRHVHELLEDGTLKKVSPGVYYYPKQTVYGEAPADEETLVRTFLKDDRFLLTSPNAYNSLGVGTTQLYNKRVVYNHKRHGDFKLGNRQFSFRVKPHFPKKMTTEFLLVDLVNNLDSLAEESGTVLQRVVEKIKTMDAQKVQKNLVEYGSAKAKKLLSSAFKHTEQFV
jgi:hypothetical protein